MQQCNSKWSLKKATCRGDEPARHNALLVEELVPVGPLFKELVQPIILTKSDCIL